MNYNLVQEAIYEADLYYDPVTEGFVDKVKAGWKWLVSKARELYKKFKAFLKKIYNWIKKVFNNLKKKLSDKLNKKFVSESSSFVMESSYFEYEGYFKDKENEIKAVCDKLYKHIEDRYSFIINLIDKLENDAYKNREEFEHEYRIIEWDHYEELENFEHVNWSDVSNALNKILRPTYDEDNPNMQYPRDKFYKKWKDYVDGKKYLDRSNYDENIKDMREMYFSQFKYLTANEKFVLNALFEIDKLGDKVKENLFDELTERVENLSIDSHLKKINEIFYKEEEIKNGLCKTFIRSYSQIIGVGRDVCQNIVNIVGENKDIHEKLFKNTKV